MLAQRGPSRKAVGSDCGENLPRSVLAARDDNVILHRASHLARRPPPAPIPFPDAKISSRFNSPRLHSRLNRSGAREDRRVLAACRSAMLHPSSA